MLDGERSEYPEQPVAVGQIRQLLSRYSPLYSPVSNEDAHFLGGRAGFSGAWIWKLETSAGPLCLRAWSPRAMPGERLAGLHRLIAHVDRNGVTGIPVPLPDRQGATFIAESGRFWQIEPWMPGVADFALHPSAARVRAVMQRLAQWHHAAATFAPRESERTWFAQALGATSPGVAERMRQLEHWNVSRSSQIRSDLERYALCEFREIGLRMLQLVPILAPVVHQALVDASRFRIRLQPCLRDVWHDHVLFTGDEVTGLIDAGSCRTENIAADLARLSGSLFGDDRVAREQALGAYSQFHPLSAEELQLLEAFDRSEVLLSSLNWLEWLIIERRQFPDPARVLTRMRAILRRQEDFAESVGRAF